MITSVDNLMSFLNYNKKAFDVSQRLFYYSLPVGGIKIAHI